MNERGPLILMVEDDEDTALINARMLRRKGCELLLAFNAAEARKVMQNHTPDLFILDIELPDGDGFTLCEEIRQNSDAPVLFLTGRKKTEDMVAGMSMGGDYYLTKPYNMDEFAAIAARLLQKAEQIRSKLNTAVREVAELTRGPLTLDILQNRATVNGRDAKLTPKEFALLLMLMQNEDQELSGEAIYERVWGTNMNHDTGTVRQHISRLKKKLDEDNTDGFSILTEYGGGYTFTTR